MSEPSKGETAQPDWRVLVSSCDACRDLWPAFFHLLFRCWPEIPKPVYLITNYDTFADENVISIPIGPDDQWGSNTARALDKFPTKHMVYLHDDYLLHGPVNHALLVERCDQFATAGGKFLSLWSHGDKGATVPDTPFNLVPPEWLVADLQAGFWNVASFRKFLAQGINVWQGESAIRAQILRDNTGFWHVRADHPRLLDYVEGVKGGFWKPNAVQFCREQGIEPDLKTRPCPPQGNDPISKLMRSLQKRRIRWRTNRRLKRSRADGGASVQPHPRDDDPPSKIGA